MSWNGSEILYFVETSNHYTLVMEYEPSFTDLRPDNILHFKGRQQNQEGNSGTFRITEMGKPTLHSGIAEKMRRLYDRKIKRYQSPEAAIDINQILSRSDDVWALGCIFLEFIIWILCSNSELLGFTNSIL
jgi:serine/threonine protein kinase